MKKALPIFFCILVVLALVSIEKILWINAKQVSRNFELEAGHSLDFENLVWQAVSLQNCRLKKVYVIYTYQVCFDVIAKGENESKWYAAKVIFLPRRVLSLNYLTTSGASYFSEITNSRALFIVRKDGTIEDLKV